MAAGNALLITIATGLLLMGVGALVTRLRPRDGSFRPASLSDRGPSSTTRSGTAALGVGVLLAAFAVGAVVADPWLVFLLALATLVVAYLAWGVYHLARLRGLPEAHAVGLSVWLFGIVLVGGIAMKLLFG